MALTATFALASDRSFISAQAARMLADVQAFLDRAANGRLILSPGQPEGRYTLHAAATAGQALPDIPVIVSRRLDPRPVQLVLGLDFLRQYEQVCYSPRDEQVRLVS